MTIHNIFDLESSVKQNLCLLNYMIWYADHFMHTEESLGRFFRFQTDIKSRLDRLVEFGILELSLCNSYVVSQDPLIQAVIEHVNDNDRIKRNICNSCLAY